VKKYFSILLICILFSCGRNNGQAPEGILPKDTMVRILIDIHIAEARLKQRGSATPDSLMAAFQKAKEEILKRNHTNLEVFKKSYDYYMINLNGMDEIYSAIVDSLSFREARGKLD
jgi:hypothetical protein